ncbi:MAG: fumarylacetoacetate hydrolase family protein [Rhodospirillaceae bacterium]|jgi:2-keto-4-pentenoate hydratase/2-oxohepta-3-ene-1,7-dioic acid hydratase in catechol pathway|nr:fumarylacetoacetate hydrolase family protein [Rhodospirillaceae bacterium]MBT4588541.1 fumarylacetoacetate hydrolase family protein [Rhodospirillaceae bacterium]MBT4938670.1 fumarylacetoacetate hydrolase family protein [Rhodospirillaceae bacterium]MBT5939567.1 fumarylacetoacetate hydrolase family protein [Rhodospirillaceae bacterium]MBT7265955.1 fumarylacetoacetate hydrolase family protein [Rhodospirillaceae bacterium]
MKLISYKADGKARYGVVTESGIVDASTRLDKQFPTLRDVIAADALDQIQALIGEPADHALDAIEYDLPIPNVQKIMCAGRNYRAYHEVVEEGGPLQYPSIFGRFVSGFSAHGQDILDPKAGEQFDYEGELVAVIGKAGRHISEADALDHIVGYTIMNEGSVRDWMAMGTQNTPAKNFYKSGGIGPWIVTADEVGDPAEQHIYTRRNGEVVQDAGTELMIFDTKYLISHASKFTQLEAGDMIATGSPAGSIIGTEEKDWLKPGDVVEVEIPAIGTLSNTVVAE